MFSVNCHTTRDVYFLVAPRKWWMAASNLPNKRLVTFFIVVIELINMLMATIVTGEITSRCTQTYIHTRHATIVIPQNEKDVLRYGLCRRDRPFASQAVECWNLQTVHDRDTVISDDALPLTATPPQPRSTVDSQEPRASTSHRGQPEETRAKLQVVKNKDWGPHLLTGLRLFQA